MSGPLLLASASPRRTELLNSVGLEHIVTPVSVDESWHEGEPPVTYAKRVATAKAESAASRKGESLVLAADTVVWTSPRERPLQKPRDRDEAAAMLHTLTAGGDSHFVTTAYCIIDRREDPAVVHVESETTLVFMRALTAQEQTTYLDSEEWKDKAGGYAIQGRAAAFVLRIEGSYTNVVGLPVAQVLALLQQLEA